MIETEPKQSKASANNDKHSRELLNFESIINCPTIFFNILVWIFLLVIFIIKHYFVTIPLFVFVYIVYILVFCLASPVFSYLSNRTTNQGIYDRMQAIFTQPPKITLSTHSYHYSPEHERDHKKVYTHRENMDLSYYSWKDISGLFLLKTDENKCLGSPIYLLLQVKNDINFADAISIDDYKQTKMNLLNKNKHKDQYIEEKESRTYDGYKQYNLVKIGNEESWLCSRCVFIVFLIFTLGIVFCIMFNSKCIKQAFVVRKIISTRYNLVNDENNKKYNSFRPTLSIQENMYEYDASETGCVYESQKIDIPTLDELERAKMYENEVPQYYCSQYINGVGVVNDMNAASPASEVGFVNNNGNVIILDKPENEDDETQNLLI